MSLKPALAAALALFSGVISTPNLFASHLQHKIPSPKSMGDNKAGLDDNQESNLPEEMRARLAIERAEEEHKKVIDYARQLGELTDEMCTRHKEDTRLAADDFKKLGIIERL